MIARCALSPSTLTPSGGPYSTSPCSEGPTETDSSQPTSVIFTISRYLERQMNDNFTSLKSSIGAFMRGESSPSRPVIDSG